MKRLEFLGSSREKLRAMPVTVRRSIGLELMRVQFGGQPTDFKPMTVIGLGVFEVRVRDDTGVYRAMYVAKFADTVFVLHAFQKKTEQTSKLDIELAQMRYRKIGSMRWPRK